MRLPFPFFTRTHERTNERTNPRTQPGVIIDGTTQQLFSTDNLHIHETRKAITHHLLTDCAFEWAGLYNPKNSLIIVNS